jgi:lysophospholipase L1-like esterase
MRALLRHSLALAAGAALLGGCTTGGAPAATGSPTAGSPSAHTSHSTPSAAPAAPARPWNVHPATVAALGDSITRGFDACKPLLDCPDVSWATGTRDSVGSVASRVSKGAGWNLARTGARVRDLPAQAREAAAHKPAMVTILIGANDVCRRTTAAMTSVADFRADFAETLRYLHRTLPATQVLVASVPDLRRLWSVGRDNALAQQLWKLGLCPTMLDDPTSDAPAARARRTAVRDRVVAYNAAMGAVCAQYVRCRYDGGAVFRYAFGADQLSTWDWFHPNPAGQHELATLLWGIASRPPE